MQTWIFAVLIVFPVHMDAIELAQKLFTAPKYKVLLPPVENWHDVADAIVMRTGSLTRQVGAHWR